MPVRAVSYIYDTSDPPKVIGLHIEGAGNTPIIETLYSDIPGNPGTPAWVEKFRQNIQDKIDFRIPLSDPSLAEDPDALVDPQREDFFHEGGDLVARSIIFETEWDEGIAIPKFHRANPY